MRLNNTGKEMHILYITYTDMDNVKSGSSLRPVEMLKAFYRQNVTVTLLSGEQSNALRGERKSHIHKTIEKIKAEKPDICYIESSTYPIMLKDDISLIKFISKLNIPIGYFYRDCHRHPKFSYIVKRKGIINFVKDTYLKLLQKRTDYILNKADIVYFPTLTMAEYFKFKNKKLLPPAAGKVHDVKHVFQKTAIYVGGISELLYGLSLMLEAFELLNKFETYNLILICREEELKLNKDKIKPYPWLHIKHTSGEGLKKWYQEASVALLPQFGEYVDLAISIKEYEYFSYQLPIVCTKKKEMAKIIEQNEVGIITEANAEAFAEGIKKIFESEEQWKRMVNNTAKIIENGNTWDDRAKQVIADLSYYICR